MTTRPRPAASPLFATDTLATAGPQVGLSTRLDPGSALRAQGAYQDRRLAARAYNYSLGTLGDWAAYQDQLQLQAALQTWRKTSIPITGTTAYTELVGMQAVRSVGQADIARAPCAFGANPSDSAKTYMSRSSDGSDWENSPAALNAGGAFSSVTWSSAGEPGAMFVGQASPEIAYTLDHGHAWTQVNFGLNDNDCGHYALLGGAAHYFIATTGASVYATTSLPAFGSGPAFVALPASGSALTAGSCEFADDGNTNVILVAKVNGHTSPTIYWTPSAGTSWTKAQDLTSSSTSANITYNSAAGVFVAWDDAGGVWTSPTGQTWTQVAGNATLAHGFAQGRKTMCSAGPAIIKRATNTGFAGSFVQDGIAYSFDLGATWNFWYMAFGAVIGKIRGFNNRVYVLDANALWASGPLGSPTNEL